MMLVFGDLVIIFTFEAGFVCFLVCFTHLSVHFTHLSVHFTSLSVHFTHILVYFPNIFNLRNQNSTLLFCLIFFSIVSPTEERTGFITYQNLVQLHK